MPERLVAAVVVHSVPGRTRLRIESRRHDTVYFASVATALSAIGGITSVDPRPQTGSLVIEHSSPLLRIGERAAEAGLFRIARAEPPPTPPGRTARLDPALVTAATLAAFAVWQLGKGRILPPALSLALYAAEIVRLLPYHEPPGHTK